MKIANRWIRVVVAVGFGLMNLGHGPVMTFAHAVKHDAAAVAVPAHHHGGGHHHDAAADDQAASANADANAPMTCNAFGCFITVGAIDFGAPAPELLPIGKLLSPPRAAALPGFIEPVDPPPRRHG